MEGWVIGLLAVGVAAVVLVWPGRVVHEDRALGQMTDGRRAPTRIAGGAEARTSGADLRGLWRASRRWLRGSAADERQALELQVLDGVAAALDAGLPVGRSLTASIAGATGHGADRSDRQAWALLRRAAQEGHALAPAWERLARQTGSSTAAAVARSWRVASLTGAPLAASLRVSAHASRERHRLERAVDVATAGARATVTVLSLLPLAGIVLAAVLGVGPAALYGSPVALASLAAGGVLLVVGHLLVRRMVDQVRGGAL